MYSLADCAWPSSTGLCIVSLADCAWPSSTGLCIVSLADCAWPSSTGLHWQLPGQSLVSWFWFAVLSYGQLS